MLEQLTDGQRMEWALAICPELGEIKQIAQRAEQKGFQRGYGHGVSDVGTPEQAEATAEWRGDTSHGEGAEKFDVATKPPFSKGSDWVMPASDFSQGFAGLASPFLGKLMEKRIHESDFARERVVQDSIRQLQPDCLELSVEIKPPPKFD